MKHFPQITYRGQQVALIDDHDYIITDELTIRGMTRSVPLRMIYLNQWQTPWWEEKDEEWIDKKPRLRADFVATTEINRHDFDVKWNDKMDKRGIVVNNTVSITIDKKAVWESD